MSRPQQPSDNTNLDLVFFLALELIKEHAAWLELRLGELKQELSNAKAECALCKSSVTAKEREHEQELMTQRFQHSHELLELEIRLRTRHNQELQMSDGLIGDCPGCVAGDELSLPCRFGRVSCRYNVARSQY
jgi:hypothetical protein